MIWSDLIFTQHRRDRLYFAGLAATTLHREGRPIGWLISIGVVFTTTCDNSLPRRLVG